MSSSQSEKKRRSPAALLLLALLLLSLSVGGVSAYLSMASGNVENTFTNAPYPTVKVEGSSIKVDPNGYGVYLRVAVDPCWQSTADASSILAGEPAVGYSIAESVDWKKIGDFYYHTKVITTAETISFPLTVGEVEENGYKVVVNLAAQIVQAVGETDDGTQTAVENAWGVSSTAFIAE